MKNGSIAIAVSATAFLALLGAALGQDAQFRIHSWIAFALLTLGALALFRHVDYASPAMSSSSPPSTYMASYMDGVVRYGVIATLFWGAAGMLVGVIVASQLAWPDLNFAPYLNFGRLRPLHTSAVVFAFGGNALIATSFYVVQRTTRARLWGGMLPWFVFWGYQFFIVMAATGYLLGITEGREYAEPEWYVDIWLTVVWVAYLLVFLGTLVKRKEPHIYVANWFYLSFIVTVAMLHLINNLSMPVSFEELLRILRRAGRADTVVVRPQCRWLLSHGGIPGHDVLFRAQAGQPPHLLLSSVDHPFLGLDLHVHLGRTPSLALHSLARLGANFRYGVLGHAVDAIVGWHDQRPDDVVGSLGQAAH
jgi:Cytochrome C and Quinol oxidase polypeptide I